MIECPHRDGTKCLLASAICGGESIETHDAYCNSCLQRHPAADEFRPGQIVGTLVMNHALAHWSGDRLDHVTERMKPALMAPKPPRRTGPAGPGTYFFRLTEELKIPAHAGCRCAALRAEMDDLGVDGCRSERERLLAEIGENFDQFTIGEKAASAVRSIKTGLAFSLNLLDPVRSLFDLAVERAEQEQRGVFHPQPAEIAPIRSQAVARSWQGSCDVKPWEFNVTAVVPVLDTPDELELVVGLLRLQTERPYIVVVDTGSLPEKWEKIASLAAADLEVHRIAANGWKHASDPVAVAMDLATSRCATEFLFCTHSDCFLKRREVLADMQSLCARYKAVGYQISPRKHPDWQGMLGHTCTMFHVPTLDEINAGWSLRRLCQQHGLQHIENANGFPNWPDTELLINYQLRAAGVTPKILGGEENMQRNENRDFDHCRSFTCGRLYAMSEYHQKCVGWIEDAKQQARERIAEWNEAA